MYCLAEVHGNGIICTFDGDMVHKESELPFGGLDTYPTLAKAKEALVQRGKPVILLHFPAPQTCATAIWCYEGDEELIRKRLKIWSGCYGAWPIRRLNAPVPLSR